MTVSLRRERNALELRDVTKKFGNVTTVRGVSLDIRAGEFFSLLGPSGCGKTTLLRLMAGFERPDAGSIAFPGSPTDGRPAYARDVNLVFQHYALFPHLTVERNVAFGLEMSGVADKERKRRVAEALALVRLDGFDHRRPHELSGGQQQRVALARAFVTRPNVLLLDEPLGALDLQLRRDMQGELKSLQRQLGITFVYVTHDQEEALSMSDRVAVMSHGQLLQVGTPTEIYERPATRGVANFVGDTNCFEGRVEGVSRGRVRVRVDQGVIDVPEFDDAIKGSVWLFGLRPESIALSAQKPAARTNVLPGRVVEVAYLGTSVRYTVVFGDSFRLSVRTQNVGSPLLAVNQSAYAHFRPEAVVRLAPDSAGE